MKQLIFVLFIFSLSSVSYAKSCGPDFQGIDIQCIKSYKQQFGKIVSQQEKIQKIIEAEKEKEEDKRNGKRLRAAELRKNLIFPVGNTESLKKLKNTIFFYQTNVNNYGKLIIKDISRSKLRCSMYIESLTFAGNKRIEKNITLEIKNEANSWNIDRTSLDERGGADFVLKREQGVCVFKMVDGLMFKYKKFAEQEDEDKNIILFYAGLFLIGLSVFLVARTVFQDEDRFKAQEKLEDAEDDKANAPNDIVLKYSRPFFKRYFTPIIMGMKNKKKFRERYKRPLASSGMNRFLTPEDFYAFKLFLIIGFPIVFIGLREFLEEDWSMAFIPLVSIGGFFYPDIWIKGKIEQRQKNVMENMPFVVDMLALSVEAGLDFVAAMQKVIEKAPPSALVEEFETFIKETKVGASRAEGLRQLAWRVDSLPISSFCATLIAADSVGANIGPILKTLAKELRERRSAMIEKKGAQAATKILIPMIFFVLPAVLLVVVAPLALQLIGN